MLTPRSCRHKRDPSDSNGKAMHEKYKTWDDPIESDFGGAGAYSSAPEYLKILHSLLAEDGKLLLPASIQELFRPQLTTESRKAFEKLLRDPELNAKLGALPMGVQKDHALGGLVLLEDLPGLPKDGTLLWGGIPNLFWVSISHTSLVLHLVSWWSTHLRSGAPRCQSLRAFKTKRADDGLSLAD